MKHLILKVKNKLNHTPGAHLVMRHWLTVAFLLGFLVDSITLNRVDQVFDNLVLLTYVLLAMGALLTLYAGVSEKLGEKYSPWARKYMPLVIQYAFGGLLSGMLIFYGRSGAIVESWPFLAAIILAIYYNETITDRANRLIYNLTIFFIGLFSYVVLVIPVLTGKMGALVFVISGLLAVVLMYGFIKLLYKIIPHFLTLQMRIIVFMLGTVFVSFNFLYFSDIIPPIPLSLKEIGIYHSVDKVDDNTYRLSYEEGKWWQIFRRSDKVFHPDASGQVYCFARVFAPTKLETEIEHRWQYYDEAEKQWVTREQLGYSIAGGRDKGYRGYTLIENFFDGKWRCSVETTRGQVLGREVFYIDTSAAPATMTTRFE